MTRRLSLMLLGLLGCASVPAAPVTSETAFDQSREIEAFNAKLVDATQRMDNTAALALWEEDGVSLLPSTAPIEGKKAIGSFFDEVTAQIPGAKMERFELQCSGIEVSGDWASEWCLEHQVVTLPAPKPPFNGRGKLLLVLHRGKGGTWRLRREMWNQGS